MKEPDIIEWLDTLEYEPTKATVDQMQTERDAQEAPWDWAAMWIALGTLSLLVALIVPGAWWWWQLAKSAWGML